MPALALEVIVTWHGTVLDVRHLAPGARFTVGPDDADLALPHPAFTAETLTLATVDAGHARLDLPPGLDATLLVDGRIEPVTRPGGLRLLPGHKARIVAGDAAVLFALVPVEAAPPPARVELIDRGGRRALGLAALLHAAVLAVAFSFPVAAEVMKLDPIDERWLSGHFEVIPEQTRPDDLFADLPVTDEPAGDSGDGPADLALPRPRTPAPTGGDAPSVEARKATARAAADEMRRALDDALGDANPLGAEAHAALGNMFGGQDGHAEALGGVFRPGMGGTGIAPGAGGGPSVGVAMRTRGRGTEPGYGRPEGKIPGRETHKPILVMREPAEVIGGLDREEIARVVRRHRDAVRHCYERELQSRPDLEGKVVMRFVVGGNGAVLAAKAAESTLADPTVEACIARQIQTWQFPAVQGGGVVVVRYPFLFRAGR